MNFIQDSSKSFCLFILITSLCIFEIMAKRLLCFISILFMSHFAKGQEDTTKLIKPDSVYEQVDVKASFKGGREAWVKFLANKLDYPAYAIRHRIEGLVLVKFVVEEDGTIKDAEAKWGPEELHQEAIRVVEKSPKWIPAQKDGKNVKSFMAQTRVIERYDTQTGETIQSAGGAF